MNPQNIDQIKAILRKLPVDAYRISQAAYASGGHPSKAVEAAMQKRVDEILKLLEAPNG